MLHRIPGRFGRIIQPRAAFSVHKNLTNQTGLTHNAYTPVTWGAEGFDVGGYFASNAWTPPAGRIQLNASIFCTGGAASSSGVFVVSILKNGSFLKEGVGTAIAGLAGFAIAHVSCVDIASGSDAYTVSFFYTSALGANDGVIDGSPAHTHFSGALI
jgi:hypothetical protein